MSSGSLRATFSGQLAAKKVRVPRQHTVVSRDFTTINLQTTVSVGREVVSEQRATSVRERVQPDWCVISTTTTGFIGFGLRIYFVCKQGVLLDFCYDKALEASYLRR